MTPSLSLRAERRDKLGGPPPRTQKDALKQVFGLQPVECLLDPPSGTYVPYFGSQKGATKPKNRTNSTKEFSELRGVSGSLPSKTRVLRQIAPESSPERSAKSLSHSFFVVPFLSPSIFPNREGYQSRFLGERCPAHFRQGASIGKADFRRLKFIQYRTGVWKCHRSLSPDPSPSAGQHFWTHGCAIFIQYWAGVWQPHRASTIPPSTRTG